MSKTNESRIVEGACKKLTDFEAKVDKYYIKRPGKKKLKTEEGEESKVLCDIIEAIDDKEVLAWPATIGANKIAILLKNKEDEDILETWGDVIKGLEVFCKNNKILKPIRAKRFEKAHRYLRIFVDKYKVFIMLLSRLYLYRKGRDGDLRCAIHVSLEDRKIWLWPVKGTNNLIAVCLEAESLKDSEWMLILTDIRRRADENGVDFDKWDRFTPPE